MTDHYEARCPSCGGFDEQGCYADCPKDELTRLRSEYEAMCAKDYDNATLIHSLRSDLEKAKEALKPFANEWEVNWTGFHNYTDDDELPLDDLTGCTLDAGHLRAAARILSQLENSK